MFYIKILITEILRTLQVKTIHIRMRVGVHLFQRDGLPLEADIAEGREEDKAREEVC